jgi:hypothetical protein
MYDDTGALKEAYYGTGSAGATPAAPSSGIGDFINPTSLLLTAVNPVLGLASGVLGGIFQNKANKANIQMQRETNALNYRMFQEGNQFNERMWHMQNEYNTPEAQAQRLKAAGINPAFVFGNGSISEAGGISSASPPSMQAPHVDPYNPVPAAQTAIDAFMQSQINSAQISNMHENERHLSIQNDLDMLQMYDKVNSLRLDNRTKQQWYDYLDKNMSAMGASIRHNNAKLQAETENLLSNAMATTLHSQVENSLARWQIRLNERELDKIDYVIGELSARIGYYGALTQTERKKKIAYDLDNQFNVIDLNIHKELKDQIKAELKAQMEQTVQEWDDYEPNWWNRTIQGYIPFVSPAVSPGTRSALERRPVRVRGFTP